MWWSIHNFTTSRETLKELNWSGMDEIFSQMLLLGEDNRPFAKNDATITSVSQAYHQQSSLCLLQLARSVLIKHRDPHNGFRDDAQVLQYSIDSSTPLSQ